MDELVKSRKIIGHLLYATSSFVRHSIAIYELNLELKCGNAQFGSKSSIFRPVRPWNLMDDILKKWGTSAIAPQAVCIIA